MTMDSTNAGSLEPLGLWVVEDDVSNLSPKARSWQLEFSSRGDRVRCQLAVPSTGPPTSPVVLCLAGAGETSDSTRFPCASALIESGVAVAMLNLPLHGPRKSPKFSERLVGALTAEHALDDNGRALVQEYARQSKSDISRALTVLADRPTIDESRVGLLGIGVGANLAVLGAENFAAVGPLASYKRGQAPDPSLDGDAALAQRPAHPVLEAPGLPGDDATAFFLKAFAKS